MHFGRSTTMLDTARIVVTKRAPSPIWTVSTWVPDEHEGDIFATTDDHAQIAHGASAVLRLYARRLGYVWLARSETQILYPRTDGTIGSVYPDLLVAHDVALPGTDPFRILEVGKPPDLVAEVLSKETAKNDVGAKQVAYAEMGVREYVTFDPRPRKKLALAGYRLLDQGHYTAIAPHPAGGFWLESIGLRIMAEAADRAADKGPRLRFFTAGGAPLLQMEEEADLRLAEQEARARARIRNGGVSAGRASRRSGRAGKRTGARRARRRKCAASARYWLPEGSTSAVIAHETLNILAWALGHSVACGNYWSLDLPGQDISWQLYPLQLQGGERYTAYHDNRQHCCGARTTHRQRIDRGQTRAVYHGVEHRLYVATHREAGQRRGQPGCQPFPGQHVDEADQQPPTWRQQAHQQEQSAIRERAGQSGQQQRGERLISSLRRCAHVRCAAIRYITASAGSISAAVTVAAASHLPTTRVRRDIGRSVRIDERAILDIAAKGTDREE